MAPAHEQRHIVDERKTGEKKGFVAHTRTRRRRNRVALPAGGRLMSVSRGDRPRRSHPSKKQEPSRARSIHDSWPVDNCIRRTDFTVSPANGPASSQVVKGRPQLG